MLIHSSFQMSVINLTKMMNTILRIDKGSQSVFRCTYGLLMIIMPVLLLHIHL